MVQLRYPLDGGGDIVIATMRPETMLADTDVAMHPDDPRYHDLVERTVILPLAGHHIPIVADANIKHKFGTDTLKMTPRHDPLDFKINKHHDLTIVSAIAPDGSIDVPELPRFHGMPVKQAHEAMMEALRTAGVVIKKEEYVHEVGHCDRCDEMLEPLISEQW